MPGARKATIDRCPFGGSVVKIDAMKRDMDLVRNLLLEIEDGRRAFDLLTPEIAEILGEDGAGKMPREQAELIEYHLALLDEAGLVKLNILICLEMN